MNRSVADIRKDYKLSELNEADVFPNPFDQFKTWWQQALQSEITEVNAMCLSTVNEQSEADSRIVLLKDFDAEGFVFFTNYNSTKGRQLQINPAASILFFWKELERQVRIKGHTRKISAADSDAYYNSRPRGSRLGAWASPQSEVISGRQELDNNMHSVEKQFENQENIPRPPHWGGYKLVPSEIEFWQGRESRLHDRIAYIRQQDLWMIQRRSP